MDKDIKDSDKRVDHINSLLLNLNSKYQCIDEEVLENTPLRFVKAFDELTKGYSIDIKLVTQSALFDVPKDYDELIIVDRIEFSSLCQHHLLPFTGFCSIGYVPNMKILGLSKFARIVEAFSSRLTLQERLTQEIALSVDEILNPKGVIVYVDSIHSCMCMRGIKSKGSKTKTLFTTGDFRNNSEKKAEFLSMIKNN